MPTVPYRSTDTFAILNKWKQKMSDDVIPQIWLAVDFHKMIFENLPLSCMHNRYDWMDIWQSLAEETEKRRIQSPGLQVKMKRKKGTGTRSGGVKQQFVGTNSKTSQRHGGNKRQKIFSVDYREDIHSKTLVEHIYNILEMVHNRWSYWQMVILKFSWNR